MSIFDSIIKATRTQNSVLSDNPKEVITILGKGDGFDYFGELVNHARTVIYNYLKNPEKSFHYTSTYYSNKYRVLTKAITEPISFERAYIEGNFLSLIFNAETDFDVVNSYDSKNYVGKTGYDVVSIEVRYHISELLIKNNKLYIVKTINTRSEYPALRAGESLFYFGKDEISEKRFFVLSGNVRNSTIQRVNLYDEVPVDWEVASEEAPNTSTSNKITDIIRLEYIDNTMSGLEFEKFVGLLLSQKGFTDVKVTKASGDYGCDVVATKDYIKYAIQCKKYSNPVGIDAVQEALGSKKMYNCHVAVVLTNNTFTPNAKILAEKTNVILWGRDVLSMFMENIDIRISEL